MCFALLDGKDFFESYDLVDGVVWSACARYCNLSSASLLHEGLVSQRSNMLNLSHVFFLFKCHVRYCGGCLRTWSRLITLATLHENSDFHQHLPPLLPLTPRLPLSDRLSHLGSSSYPLFDLAIHNDGFNFSNIEPTFAVDGRQGAPRIASHYASATAASVASPRKRRIPLVPLGGSSCPNRLRHYEALTSWRREFCGVSQFRCGAKYPCRTRRGIMRSPPYRQKPVSCWTGEPRMRLCLGWSMSAAVGCEVPVSPLLFA